MPNPPVAEEEISSRGCLRKVKQGGSGRDEGHSGGVME